MLLFRRFIRIISRPFHFSADPFDDWNAPVAFDPAKQVFIRSITRMNGGDVHDADAAQRFERSDGVADE